MVPAVPGLNMVKSRRLVLFLLLVALSTGFTVALGQAQTSVPCDGYGYGYGSTGCDAYSVGCDAYTGVGCDAYSGGCPDLAITSASAPGTLTKGVPFDISYTVENIGSADAATSVHIGGGTLSHSPGMWDNVYLSTDELYDGSDTWIASSGNQDTVSAGSSYSVSTSVEVANIPSGTYYLLFVAPSSWGWWPTVSDCDPANNVLVLQQVTVEGDDPDLVITSASAPSTITKGTPFDISLTVSNQGAGTAIGHSWYDFVSGVYTPVDSAILHDFYLSTDASWDADDLRLGPGNFFHQGDLPSGDSYSATESVTAANLASGFYYLIAVSDAYDQIYETDETNNAIVIGQVTVEGPDPDLVVKNIDAPAVLGRWPDTATLTITVENQGAGIATTGYHGAMYGGAGNYYWSDQVFISTDDQLDVSDVCVTTFDIIPDLAPGESYSSSISFSDPYGLPSGDYYLIVKTDKLDYVLESDESNNIMVQPITIGAPDLVEIGRASCRERV